MEDLSLNQLQTDDNIALITALKQSMSTYVPQPKQEPIQCQPVFQSLQTHLYSLQASNQEKIQFIQDLETQLQQSLCTENIIRMEAEDLASALNNLNSEVIPNLQSKITSQEEEIQVKCAEIAQLIFDINQHQLRAQESENQSLQSNNEISRLRSENQQLLSENTQLLQKVQHSTADSQQYEIQIAELKIQIAGIQNTPPVVKIIEVNHSNNFESITNFLGYFEQNFTFQTEFVNEKLYMIRSLGRQLKNVEERFQLLAKQLQQASMNLRHTITDNESLTRKLKEFAYIFLQIQESQERYVFNCEKLQEINDRQANDIQAFQKELHLKSTKNGLLEKEVIGLKEKVSTLEQAVFG